MTRSKVTSSIRPERTPVGAPKDIPSELAEQLAALNDVAGRRYNVDFEKLARSPDNNAAARKIPYILGVMIKKEYSDPQPPFKRKGITDVKWKVNDDRLARLGDNSWQLQTFARLGENSYPDASPRVIAQTLRRETKITKFYLTNIHPYLCQTEEGRAKIDAVLKQYGLAEYSNYAHPQTAAAPGAYALYQVLLPVLHMLLAAAVAVAALSLSIYGLKRLCRSKAFATPEKSTLSK